LDISIYNYTTWRYAPCNFFRFQDDQVTDANSHVPADEIQIYVVEMGKANKALLKWQKKVSDKERRQSREPTYTSKNLVKASNKCREHTKNFIQAYNSVSKVRKNKGIVSYIIIHA